MAKKKAGPKRSQTVTAPRKRSAKDNALTAVSPDRVEGMIMLLRGERVIPDYDLAKLYGVATKALNQAVKRNIERFPEDFMFQLTWDEAKDLRSQSVTLNGQDGGAASRSQFVTLKRGKGNHVIRIQTHDGTTAMQQTRVCSLVRWRRVHRPDRER